MPSELVNSVISSPQPPRPRITRRNSVSVTPAIGASTAAGVTVKSRILNEARIAVNGWHCTAMPAESCLDRQLKFPVPAGQFSLGRRGRLWQGQVRYCKGAQVLHCDAVGAAVSGAPTL